MMCMVSKTSPCCPCSHVTIEFGSVTRLSLKMFVVIYGTQNLNILWYFIGEVNQSFEKIKYF